MQDESGINTADISKDSEALRPDTPIEKTKMSLRYYLYSLQDHTNDNLIHSVCSSQC